MNQDLSALLREAAKRGATPAELRSQCIGYVAAEVGVDRAIVESALVTAGVIAPACSCPSGDGSLRHPCTVHPQAAPVDALAQFIRTIDGNHSMGAGALAEALCGRFHVAEASS